MIYQVSGTDRKGALAFMAKALPVMRSYGAPTDMNTCVIPADTFVVGPDGELLPDASPVIFYFPRWDDLADLESLENDLTAALGVPCYTLDAPVVVGFPPRPK